MRASAPDAALRAAFLAACPWLLFAAIWLAAAPLAHSASPVVPPLPAKPERALAQPGSPLAAGRAVPESYQQPQAAEAADRSPDIPTDMLAADPLSTPFGPDVPSVDTVHGRLAYTRALDVVATYYTPADGGKPRGSPAYGITATGARATRGIVAVDPRVIPLYSWLYVPGYGFGQARDVGGAIIGNHIDVAFDDGDGAWWGRRELTVYVLASPAGGR